MKLEVILKPRKEAEDNWKFPYEMSIRVVEKGIAPSELIFRTSGEWKEACTGNDGTLVDPSGEHCIAPKSTIVFRGTKQELEKQLSRILNILEPKLKLLQQTLDDVQEAYEKQIILEWDKQEGKFLKLEGER